jgi:hypothetical protein
MIGYILTQEQAAEVQGVFITPYLFINCVQDINGIWFLFLSNQDIPLVKESQYAWVLTLPQAEYIPPPPPPFPI